MTARELRQKYLDFFASKDHQVFPSGSLVPYDVTGRLDESLLFNGAGMVQFKPYFRGVAKPPHPRLTNAQKVVRTGDIDEVGDLTHLTFFEMMGNFSFGDYFKKDAIAFSWEFITSPQWLNLDPQRMAVTVFLDDDESYGHWSEFYESVGIDPATRIFRRDEDENYWPAGAFTNGPPGPCGPNSEMYYWTSNDVPPPSGAYGSSEFEADEPAGKWLEFWNDVFIQFEWQGELKDPERAHLGYRKTGMPTLPFRSVDTGMGLERAAAVLGGFHSVYEIDVFEPIFAKISELVTSKTIIGKGSTLQIDSGHVEGSLSVEGKMSVSGRLTIGGGSKSYGANEEVDRAYRIIADHARTACFCIADGILPGNSGRRYVLRRIIRRAALKGLRVLDIKEAFLHRVFDGVLDALGDHYTGLAQQKELITQTLRLEEDLFRKTLAAGQSLLESEINAAKSAYWWILDPHGEWNDPVSIALVRAVAQGADFSEASKGIAAMDAKSARILIDNAVITLGSGSANAAWSRLEPYIGAAFEYPFLEVETLAAIREVIKNRGFLLSGRTAFQLYDTYGFPLEVTKELCAEAGIEVDEEGYEAALKEAQERSRGASGMETVYGGVEVKLLLGNQAGGTTPTNFVGYGETKSPATIVAALPAEDGSIGIALDQTPFYAESGGQVSDTGVIHVDSEEAGPFDLRVVDLIKQDGVYVHLCEASRPELVQGKSADELNAFLLTEMVVAEVDEKRRRSITRNHTATHLLHAALRDVLGKHVTQAGSLVSPEHLRFDFTHGKAMSPEEIRRVEEMVNEHILASIPVTIFENVPIEEAKTKGAMALFGEKYGEFVRVVQIPGFSTELCGGIHVRNTSEIGLFRILHEASAASGVRRIEAITGEASYRWATSQAEIVREAADRLKASPRDLLAAVEKLVESLREEKRKREKAEFAMARGGGIASDENADWMEVGPFKLWSKKFEDLDQKIVAAAVDDAVASNKSAVAVAALVAEGRITFIAKVGADALSAGAHAGNLLKEVSRLAGGGGGGRPDFATAGGKDASKVDEALGAVVGLLGGTS